jgi:hypothetical protein
MQRRDIFILIGIVLAVGAAAFYVGRTAATRRKAPPAGGQPGWLGNVPGETAQAEQHFAQQARERMDAVRAERAVLASMLPDSRFTGEQVLAQVDSIVQSHATLAKSVGVHLAGLHSNLPEAQGQRLMLSCANSLHGSMQRRYRWRGGAQDQGEGFMGGRGGGPGHGAGGRGAGYGKQYRGGRSDAMPGLARRLQLTQEQNTWIQERDPNFEGQCVLLRDRLHEAHGDLVASFEEARTAGGELVTKIESLMAAHGALEKRVARHIVLLRPQLSQEQRDRLSGLSRGRPEDAGDAASTSQNPVRDVLAGAFSLQVLADLLP